MLPTIIKQQAEREFTVLCLGAHCDDLEIGCGGTLLTMCDTVPKLNIHWLVFSSNEVRYQEAFASANEFTAGAHNKRIEILGFRDGFLPYAGHELKEKFEQLKAEVQPDLVFTHYRNDLHQDHRQINELTWNTFRNHLILEYEIIKYDGDIGNPNIYSPIEKAVLDKKNELILKHYASQKQKQWFSAETFGSLARIRGVEANSASGYAEAFYGRKVLVTF